MKICCTMLDDIIQSKEYLIGYSPMFREFYMTLLDSRNDVGFFVGKQSRPMQCLNWCPFCGAKLPSSLRTEWHDILNDMGIEEPLFKDEHCVPDDFTTDKWWKDRGI